MHWGKNISLVSLLWDQMLKKEKRKKRKKERKKERMKEKNLGEPALGPNVKLTILDFPNIIPPPLISPFSLL